MQGCTCGADRDTWLRGDTTVVSTGWGHELLSAPARASHPHWVCSTDHAEWRQRCTRALAAGNAGGADHTQQTETTQKALQWCSGQHAAFRHRVKPGQTPLLLQEGPQLYRDTPRSDAAFRSAQTHRHLRTESISHVFWGKVFPSAALAPAREVLPPELGQSRATHSSR